MTSGLEIKNLAVSITNTRVLNGVCLTVKAGEVHALMGQNGSGKSSLAHTLMGHPAYEVNAGTIMFSGESLENLSADMRAKRGLFLAFQYPFEIEGVRFYDFLRQSYNALYAGTEKQLGLKAFRSLVDEKMALLGIRPDFIERAVNVGFSGGEKKRAEMLTLALLQPKIAILDEIDSGLDIDGLATVAESIKKLRISHPSMSFIIITHYQRILEYIEPGFVHLMKNGAIARSGDASLAADLERYGYDHCLGER